MIKLNLIYKIFGRLLVIYRLPSIGRYSNWRCLCICGNLVSVIGRYLTTEKTRSCGCLLKETARLNGLNTKIHGETHKTSEYTAWCTMRYRCSNKNSKDFHYYGGRGIKVCTRWINSYKNFLMDMGRKPNNEYSLDRIDNNGNYELSNCRWATKSQQMANRRKYRHKS